MPSKCQAHLNALSASVGGECEAVVLPWPVYDDDNYYIINSWPLGGRGARTGKVGHTLMAAGEDLVCRSSGGGCCCCGEKRKSHASNRNIWRQSKAAIGNVRHGREQRRLGRDAEQRKTWKMKEKGPLLCE